MSLSRSLLVLALAVAVVPVAMIGLRPPRSVRDLEKAIVSGTITLVVGAIVVHGFHRLSFFGLAHLLYLLAVVTVPVIGGAWFAFAWRDGLRRIDRFLGALALIAALCGIYGTHIEPNWLRVDRVELRANVAAPLRIGVLADLQTPNIGGVERRAVDELVDRSPDLVVVPGDLFQGPVAELEANRSDFVDLLRDLVAGTQLVAVTSGDSDHDIDLRSLVEEAGALFIDDMVVGFEIDGVPIRLAGVRVAAAGPERQMTLDRLREPSDALTVLVAHRPDAVYELAADADVDVVISGHTHGGQVQLPFFGPPVTFSDVPRDLAAGGLGVVDNVPLYVSAGVGLERHDAPQVRFGARPEVGIIDVLPR